MFKDFKEFVMRGNVMDLAVGIVIGAAFGAVIASFVTDILTPPLGLLLGGVDFTNLFISLSDRQFATLAEAKAAGAPTLNYGVFLNSIVSFLIVAFAIFLLVRQINRARGPAPAAEPTRDCPFCASKIAARATRCPFCTSEVK